MKNPTPQQRRAIYALLPILAIVRCPECYDDRSSHDA